jgi:hypothetical protein
MQRTAKSPTLVKTTDIPMVNAINSFFQRRSDVAWLFCRLITNDITRHNTSKFNSILVKKEKLLEADDTSRLQNKHNNKSSLIKNLIAYKTK